MLGPQGLSFAVFLCLLYVASAQPAPGRPSGDLVMEEGFVIGERPGEIIWYILQSRTAESGIAGQRSQCNSLNLGAGLVDIRDNKTLHEIYEAFKENNLTSRLPVYTSGRVGQKSPDIDLIMNANGVFPEIIGHESGRCSVFYIRPDGTPAVKSYLCNNENTNRDVYFCSVGNVQLIDITVGAPAEPE